VVGAVLLLLATASIGLGATPGTNPFTSAIIKFNQAGTVEAYQGPTKLPANFNTASLFYWICWPPGASETNTTATGTLDVSPDGKLTGSCTESFDQHVINGTGGTKKDKAGTLTATYDIAAQRIVALHYEGGSTYAFYKDPNSTCADCPDPVNSTQRTFVIDGIVSGGEVQGDVATGLTRFTQTCTLIGATGDCGFNGMAGPTAGGGPTGSDDGLDLPTAILFLILLALVLLGLGWMFRMRTRSYRTAGAINEAGIGLSGMIGDDAVPTSSSADAQAADDLNFLEASATWGAEQAERAREAAAREAANQQAGDAPSAEAGIKEEAGKILDALDVPGGGESPAQPDPTSVPGAGGLLGSKPEGGALGYMVRQTIREQISPSVGADRSGGFEDQTSYGEGAGTASPAAEKAYEANVVAQSGQKSPDEPLTQPSEADAAQAERDAEREGDAEKEGR
jgi:hypothetical protein